MLLRLVQRRNGMNWTAERFVAEWDELLAPMPWLIEGLEIPAKRSIAAAIMDAYELRKDVNRCRAWRHKSANQIDEDFMKMVILPLVRNHPLADGDGKLLPWNDNYKDPRGPKRLAPRGELEIVFKYLKNELPKLSREVEIWENTGMKEPISQAKNDVIAHKIVLNNVILKLERERDRKLELVYDVNGAMNHLTAVGISCSKIDVDAFWLILLATVWAGREHTLILNVFYSKMARYIS